MNRNELISAGFYLRGDALDPEKVTRLLGVEPSDSQYKGEKRITSTKREYIKNIGMWSLIAQSESLSLSELISEVTSKIKYDDVALHNIEGVQEAYLDVFIAGDTNEEGDGSAEFELSKDNLVEIKRLGLSVSFTVTFSKP